MTASKRSRLNIGRLIGTSFDCAAVMGLTFFLVTVTPLGHKYVMHPMFDIVYSSLAKEEIRASTGPPGILPMDCVEVICATREIEAGEKFSDNNLVVRPVFHGGLNNYYFIDEIYDRTAARTIAKKQAVTFNDVVR